MSNLYFNSFRKNFNVLSRMIFIIILILSISKISYSRTIGNLEKNSQEKTFSVKKNNNGKNFPRPRKKATLETDSIKNKTSQEENQVVKIYPKAQKWWTGYTTLSTSGNYDAKDGDIKAGTNLIGGKKNRGYIVFDISDRLRIPSNAIIKYVKLYIYPIKTPLTNYDATIAVKRLTVDPLASPGAEALYKNIGDTKDIVRNPEWYPYTLNQYNSVNLNTGPLQAAITSEKTTWAIGLQDRNKFNLTFDNDNNGGFAGWESNYMPYCEVTYHTPSPAKLSVNTTSIDLGTHPAGYSFSNNSLKISNSGEQTLTGTLSKSANWINSLSITGFSLVANTSTNIPVSGTFPSTTGSFSSTINITSNGGSSTITYKGKIQEIPILNINKTSFDLGTQRGGRNNTEISPAIKNTGTGTLTGSVSTSGDIIASATPASFSLTAGQWIKENIEVSFPTSPGTYSGIVNVTSNGGSGKITVKVIIGTPPTANFSGTPTSGKVPLTVVFTDKSTNNPTSWYWDFGDGSSSNDQNPSHTFQKVGSYTVDLTANSNYGTDDKTIKDYIVVGDAPVADFSASPTSGAAPLNVNFTDKSTNNPTSWTWDFGDGSTSNDQNPSHTYQNAGKYTVKLTATNKYGNDTKSSDNYITAGDAHTGSLKVIISPSEAVDAGAQWNVDGGSWQNSGVTANNLSVGQHTVNYKDVSGWTAPSSMDVTISENQTKSVTGTYIVVSSTSSWKDSFESYTVNTFPSIWTADGNATDNSKNYVDNNYSYEGNQSLRLYGQIGYCWGALAYHPVNLSPPFYITVYIRNGNEILSGCHPNRAGIGLREGTSWQNPDRGFMTFQQDGTITSGGKSVDLGSYESLKWYKIKVLYEVLANNQIKLSYWINDSYKGSEVLSSIDEEDKLTNLSLSVDEGNAWFDNVIISQETDGVNDQHLGQSIKIYPNPTKSGLNIRLKDLSFKNISILLYDSYGKLLTTRHFIQTPSGPVQFHLSGYPAGLYYIQFVTNYGKATKKFIIER